MMTKYCKAIDMLFGRENRTTGYKDTQSKQPLGNYSSVKMLRHTVLCISNKSWDPGDMYTFVLSICIRCKTIVGVLVGVSRLISLINMVSAAKLAIVTFQHDHDHQNSNQDFPSTLMSKIQF